MLNWGPEVFLEVNTNTIYNETYFVEIGIMLEMPRTADVKAKMRTLIAVLRREELTSIVKNYPHIAKGIREQAEKRFRELQAFQRCRGNVNSFSNKETTVTSSLSISSYQTNKSNLDR
jgi:CRP-like cAMP-binding protein